MVKIKPFENAANWTATITCEKGNKTKYPVDYVKWETNDKGYPGEDMSLEEVMGNTSRSVAIARPSSPAQTNSVWIVSTKGQASAFAKMQGRFMYKIHEGVNPGGAVGIYWLAFIRSLTKTTSLFENQPELAKKHTDKQQVPLETELVFPHLRWGDVNKWRALPSNYILIPQDFKTRIGIDIAVMKRNFPKAYAYLLQFREFLLSRTKSIPKDPFYSILGVSTAALAKYKICWRALGENTIKPVVVEWNLDKNLGRNTPALCQWTCYFISSDDQREAHFVCGLLSSSLLTLAIKARGVSGGKNFGSSKQFVNINFPRFDVNIPIHRSISSLSEKCHAAAKGEEHEELAKLERQIDEAAAELWEISKKELGAMENSRV